ncbi:MAG TPA: PHP domain-containing protein [Bryobacteraceae bacterium]|nr:PHP domain-containing protein [Bryobacteraceae bacterium]
MAALSNADIAKTLLGVAQLLSLEKGNDFKVKAYRRAAKAISSFSESVEELVRSDADLTTIPGIGKGISTSIREIVQRGGSLEKLDALRANTRSGAADLSEYPLLDPKRVQRVYKRLQISSVPELRDRLERGDIASQFGTQMEQHIRQGLMPSTEVLLYDAHRIAPGIETFLKSNCGAERAEATGEYRRRVEVIRDLSFVVEAANFPSLVEAFQRFGGRTTLIEGDEANATFQLPSGLKAHVANTTAKLWGLALLITTGSDGHLTRLSELGFDLAALTDGRASCRDEEEVYRRLGLQPIAPELRDGNDEIGLAASGRLPNLITKADIRGELHAHTTSSDGAQTVDQMAAGAADRGYEYLGITDHSQSLTIARGVSEQDLWAQIRYIDKLNEANGRVRVLKAAEVDILEDGSLDYPDSILKELDYTVCSIHSKFALNRTAQTQRVLRAMDNRHFNILGHATGRRLLRRPGYELDVDRVIKHARQNGCFFEINSSPQRLDLSAANARLASEAGVMIAINTDAHSTREFDFLECGIEQARRAGLEKAAVLNCLPLSRLRRLFKR